MHPESDEIIRNVRAAYVAGEITAEDKSTVYFTVALAEVGIDKPENDL